MRCERGGVKEEGGVRAGVGWFLLSSVQRNIIRNELGNQKFPSVLRLRVRIRIRNTDNGMRAHLCCFLKHYFKEHIFEN